MRPDQTGVEVNSITKPYYTGLYNGTVYESVWELAEGVIPGVYCHDTLTITQPNQLKKLSRKQSFNLRNLDKLEDRMLDWAREVDYGQMDPEFREFSEDVDYVQAGQRVLFKGNVEILSKVDKQNFNQLYKKYYLEDVSVDVSQ